MWCAGLCCAGVQVVFEAPPGLKQNIQRTYAFWSSDFLAGHVASATVRRSSSGDKHAGARRSTPTPAGFVPLRAQMLFVLAWFNAVLQERQNYVPIVSRLTGHRLQPHAARLFVFGRACLVQRHSWLCR